LAFVCFVRMINEANQTSSARNPGFNNPVETKSPP